MNHLSLIFIFIIFCSCKNTSDNKSNAEVSNKLSDADTCDNPDADINCSFLGMPSELTHKMTINEFDEPGLRMIISGKVLKADSISVCSNYIMYAYQTDSSGYYSKNGNEKGVRKWHGHLYGWCKTDINGYYEIQTIKPGRYPSNQFPAHIHCIIKKSEDSAPFYINDFVFAGDSLADEKYISSLPFQGDNGVVELKILNGTLKGERNIILNE